LSISGRWANLPKFPTIYDAIEKNWEKTCNLYCLIVKTTNTKKKINKKTHIRKKICLLNLYIILIYINLKQIWGFVSNYYTEKYKPKGQEICTILLKRARNLHDFLTKGKEICNKKARN